MSEYDVNNNPFEEEKEKKIDVGEIIKNIENTIKNTPGEKIYHRHECESNCGYWINAMISKRNPHLNQTICPLCGSCLKVID